ISNLPLQIYQNVIANEDWDEGLPVLYRGADPFGPFYRGINMPVRWTDDDNKRERIEQVFAAADYVILPSQRALWSVCRLPEMYPMTLAYYRALFDGGLGFDLAARFQATMKIGPLWISDTGGTLAWMREPDLPRFNFNSFAAEEAFSVYDHPPVWIFQKRTDFSLANAVNLLEQVDLSQAVYQQPHDTRVSRID
ncbi:MAG TPA: hypothetical protein VHO48_11585, partial [Anaerolineaceae bacterium]|nr:hypothetical protein [Anaerolineaceae bacterium]